METVLLALLFLLLSAGIFSLLSYVFRRRIPVEERVRREVEETETAPVFDTLGRRVQAVAKPLGKLVPRSEEDLAQEASRLVQAGIRSREAVYVFHGIRVLLFPIAILVFLVTGLMWTNPLLYLILSLLVAVGLPELWLRWKIGRRKQNIEWALPDFMDLSVVCVEAGLGLDQTLQRVGQEIGLPYPDLSEELRLYGLEVNAGMDRATALRNLARRTGVDELRSFAAVLIQADRFGTGVGQTLRVFADDLRIRRRQKAEEEAAKLTVKIVPPLIFFIFPAILVVTGGPAVIAIARDLLGFLGGR